MAKARRASVKARKAKTKASAKRKSKAKAKRLPARATRRKIRTKGIAGKIASAVHIVADSIRETSVMRERMRKRGMFDEG